MQIIQIIHKDNSAYVTATAFYQISFQACISILKLEKISLSFCDALCNPSGYQNGGLF